MSLGALRIHDAPRINRSWCTCSPEWARKIGAATDLAARLQPGGKVSGYDRRRRNWPNLRGNVDPARHGPTSLFSGEGATAPAPRRLWQT